MITSNEYEVFDKAYKYFNEKLFAGNLPDCLITLQRKNGVKGYFSYERLVSRNNPNNLISEIALNPDCFGNETDIEILSTILLELVHCWQFYLGNRPEKPKYHDQEWGNMMESLGLLPSTTGEEGGRKTGNKVSHYIIPNGKFEKLATEFLKDNKINWQNIPLSEKQKKERKTSTKHKYFCPGCERTVTSKFEMNLTCKDCDRAMEEEIS